MSAWVGKRGSRSLPHRLSLARVGAGARTALAALRRDRALAVGTVLVLLLVLAAFVGPLVWRTDPLAVDLPSALEGPSAEHPMGTDANGRDVLARFNRGAQISLGIGAFVVVAGAAVGGFLGLLSGTSRGLVDSVVMRSMDALLAFPPLILAMAVTVGLGVGLTPAAVAVALTAVAPYARLVRSEVVRVRGLPMIEAAVALGASRRRVMFRHILPQTTSTLLVQSAAVFGYAILTLAGLGFVGLGAQLPTPEWGAMITEGLEYSLTGAWWLGVFPGLGLMTAVVAANLLAGSVQAILDPRGLRGGA